MDRFHASALAALALLALSSAPAHSAPQDSAGAYRPAPPQFEIVQFVGADSARHEVERGRFVVPEVRGKGVTRPIRLAFYRLRSTSKTPGTPIVFLAGGPGIPGTAMARIPEYYALFERLRESGDVILLDQRGTGLTQPDLACGSADTLASTFFESESLAMAAIRARLHECAERHRSKGVALDAYQTNENADDVDDLRRSLGAERIRLLAVSYGTELALAVMRRHPSRVERAVLAGVRGADHALRLPSVLDLQLRRISDLARADSAYAKMKPDVETVARQFLEGLGKKPLPLAFTERASGRTMTYRIGRFGFQTLLQAELGDGRSAALIPAMLYTMARGDASVFLGSLRRLHGSIATGLSAMAIATDCATGCSDERRAQVEREAALAILGNTRNLLFAPELCAEVGSPDLGPRYRTRIYSRTPALFVSGSLDPITPPFQAEDVRWGFPNAVHLVVENGFHETLTFGEVQDAVAAYFRGEDVRGRRIELPPPRFLTIEEAKAVR